MYINASYNILSNIILGSNLNIDTCCLLKIFRILNQINMIEFILWFITWIVILIIYAFYF